ncbi:MAG: aldo/keto reductase, partial [Candidatus Andersenbacteria bacterium]|nr:aldo/keto reductase [Candidatus Andersenbacteria bacterium]
MSIQSTSLGQTGLTVSRLGLGTVEIGLPYGIGATALPSDKEAERILKTALELGITYFDTARGYGVAEERLGKFGISKKKGVVIGTKCGQFLKQEPNLAGSALDNRIRADIDLSRRALRHDSLPLVLLHLVREDANNFDE